MCVLRIKKPLLDRPYLALVIALLFCMNAWATQWMTSSPEGGEVRSLALDPQNPDQMFLGTSSGTIFISTDAGHTWSRLAHLGRGDDYVIDHIAVDPRNSRRIYAAIWSLANHHGGDFFRSLDGGATWQAVPSMHARSIRSLAVSASSSGLLVVGALDGVFRSQDGGQQWRKISAVHPEIKNVESIAIDPRNSDVIYAGTWHLAWKTVDGGNSWRRIDKGMIDDSDVFSIIVDSANPDVVYAGACSGIYKSRNGGHVFERILEIPFSARRTRVLRQDPNNSSIVYAGTTEGLWVTSDFGDSWRRVTSPEIVVNDVSVDPRDQGHVLLATDRAGVLRSDSPQLNFRPSNSGFTHRYITSILADRENPEIMYLGVVNDRELGGVFVSEDGGKHWAQKSMGLDGRDVFALKQANDGAIIAGTNQGVFVLARYAGEWSPLGAIVRQGIDASVEKDDTARPRLIAGVRCLEVTHKRWLAATFVGLYVSLDKGASWRRVPVFGHQNIIALQARDNLTVLATPKSVLVSTDGGDTWRRAQRLPLKVSSVASLVVTSAGDIVIASTEGVFRTRNRGASWQRAQRGLPKRNVSGLAYDEKHRRLLAITSGSTTIFESNENDLNWHRGPDPGVPLHQIAVADGKIIAATRFDGIIVGDAE